MISAAEQFRLISHGVADLLPEDEFKKKLEKSVATNTPLIGLGSNSSRYSFRSYCSLA